MITNMLIGLLVLSLMVFIHELGHFLVAKLCGVVVESFSIGWGPILLKKKIGDTEYRLSLVPIGGYCGMKGERAFITAIEQNLSAIPKEIGSLYNASPKKRVLIAFAGPFANYVCAVVCFAIVSSMGSIYYTYSNKIAPLHLYEKDVETSAKEADLKMGDIILEINGKKIDNFRDITQNVITSADIPMLFKIERDGAILNKTITPKIDKKTGAGIVGIYPFIQPKIGNVFSNGAAYNAGLLKGDVIKKVEGKPVENTIDFQKEMNLVAQTDKDKVSLTYERNGHISDVDLHIVRIGEGVIDSGIVFESKKFTVDGAPFFKSIWLGFSQTHDTIFLTFRSFAALFKGVDIKNAVSGPLRITHMIGDVAQEGFKINAKEGWRGILYFIGIISVSLFIMNLLPIPVIDGGLILLSFIEMIMRRDIHPKITMKVQFIGFVFIAILLILAIVADIFFLAS